MLPLTGACNVDTDAGGAELAGRSDVFTAITDCAYVPRDTAYRISTPDGGRFALASARSQAEGLPFRHVRADEVKVELRGAGSCSRRVSNFGTPDVLEADRLIACEVFTRPGTGHRSRRTSMIRNGQENRSWRRSTTSRWPAARIRVPDLAWLTSACTARRNGRPTCWPRCAAGTW